LTARREIHHDEHDEQMDSSTGKPGPYRGFEGTAHRTFGASTPHWPRRPSAPERAPNVVVMLVDDLGFSDLGCYGSEIATPTLDEIADQGLRFSNFHVNPLCSPTRASLLTGRNPHAVGVGMVSNNDPGFPGYAGELPAHQPTMAEVFRANGYSTLMVGKWHLTKDSEMHEAASKHAWPLQRGFDQFYGFLEAMTNFHHPHRLYEGNAPVDVESYPDDYYLTDDLTDRALRMIRGARAADPSKPFFLYFSHGAVHAPLQAPAEEIARQRGRYDEGWDAVRDRRLRRQIELGVMPAGTELPPRNSEPHLDVPAWDSLPEDDRRVMARYMEVYAAMVESIDRSAARVKELLEELGEWDDTVFLFLSDNGASREGLSRGSSFYQRLITPTASHSEVTDQDRDLFARDEIGGPRSWPHYPRGWAMACNTPFRLYKITAYRGGHTVPMVVRWPGRVTDAGSIRDQYLHVTDLLPTLVDSIGLQAPASRHGEPADPYDGVSFRALLGDPDAPSEHTEQYVECNGNRAYYRDGWEAVTMREPLQPSASLPSRTGLVPLSQEPWALYDVAGDPTQATDLAAEHPDLLEDLKSRWDEAAWRNQVFPINEGAGANHLRRSPGDEVLERPVTLLPGTPTLERYRSLRLIAARPFRITVEADFTAGCEGVLVAHGGQESGYALMVRDGRLRFTQNFFGAMSEVAAPAPSGMAEVHVDVTLDTPGAWTVTLRGHDEQPFATGRMPALRGMTPFQGIDVGADRRSPVDWATYERHRSFPFTGVLRRVRYQPGVRSHEALDALIEEAIAVGAALE